MMKYQHIDRPFIAAMNEAIKSNIPEKGDWRGLEPTARNFAWLRAKLEENVDRFVMTDDDEEAVRRLINVATYSMMLHYFILEGGAV